MNKPLQGSRSPEAPVEAIFLDRWSPRAFTADPLSDGDIASLFEAARWSPSCYNEQPWHFVYARTSEDRERFAAPLSEKNRLWAKYAPLLVYLLARRSFQANGRPNRHAFFDAGAAWLSLALQARSLGLYAHAMAGFDEKHAHEILGAPGDHEVLVAVAVGRKGDPDTLPPHLQEREFPSGRNPPASMMTEGRFVDEERE